MTMTPLPGRRRTRATASLRRPVVWMSGLDTVILFVLSWRRGASRARGSSPRRSLIWPSVGRPAANGTRNGIDLGTARTIGWWRSRHEDWLGHGAWAAYAARAEAPSLRSGPRAERARARSD